VAYRLDGFLGWVASHLPIRETNATRVNLALCFPELSGADRRALGRRSFVEVGRYFLELGGVWGWPRERTMALITKVSGEEVLDAALAAGRGVIVVMPHIGSWELAGNYVAVRHPITGLYRPPRVREMEAIYSRARTRLGAKVVPAGAGGVRALHRALQAGEAVALLPDQDPGRGAGVFVPFFGHLANTSTLLPRLAARSGAPVVLAMAQRLRGGRFHVHFLPGSPDIHDPDPVIGATALNRDVERCIALAPEQYLWSYKRFRVQPLGHPSPYKSGRAGPEDVVLSISEGEQ
jgi:KDO2-lipid IV(A) lauroyltransferase